MIRRPRAVPRPATPRRLIGVALALAVVAAPAFTLGSPAGAATKTKPTIRVTDAWARTSPMSATTGAAYMVIENSAKKDNALVGVTVAKSVAMSAEIHETTMTGGMASMTEVEEIELPARDRQTLAPGGYHVMLIGLAKPLAVGEKVALTLDLAKGPDVTVKAVVKQ